MTWDDDDIGYGKPPRWTQFQPGRSGNPNGRPRKSPAAAPAAPPASAQDDLQRRALQRKVVITEGGERVPTAVQDLVIKAQLHAASKGNVMAQRDILRAARELEERDRQRAEQAAIIEAKAFDNIVQWRNQQARAWADAAAVGTEPAEPWPHPDDFIINTTTRQWRIHGPIDAADVPLFEAWRTDRDVYLMHSVIAIKRRQDAMAKFCACVAIGYDVMLPQRWQLDIGGWTKNAETLLVQPLPVLRYIVGQLERRAASYVRPTLSPAAQRDVYKTTNKIMLPLLRRQGYRSLKQFEAAYAEHGRALPWLRTARSA